MKQFPAVSFVMPAFNTEKFIDESIGSIMRQTVDNWELVMRERRLNRPHC